MRRRLAILKSYRLRVALAVFAAAGVIAAAADKPLFRSKEKAAFADPRTVNFVRPGLNITINSAEVATDGKISVSFALTDPRGLPLDREGITTPGTVALS